MKTKIVLFSDTHGHHDKVVLPECDIAIFCGDFSHRGDMAGTHSFIHWYNNQDQCKHKIFIAGNHDICFDLKFDKETRSSEWLPYVTSSMNKLEYLEQCDVTILGLKIWGSAVTPWFHGDYWGFNRHRGEEIAAVWKKIPKDADIIVTHGPVWGLHDYTKTGEHVGCQVLHETVDHIKPKLFACGHIHEGYGKFQAEHTLFVNAAICNEKYQPVNTPIVIEL